MKENLLNQQQERRRSVNKIKTSEMERCELFLHKLRLLTKEELERTWEHIYLEEYKKADLSRQNGAHDFALIEYRKLQLLLDFVRESGIESEDILGREAVCHYQIIQCYYNLQSGNDSIKRELYLFSDVLLEMLRNVLKDHPKSDAFLKEINKILALNNQISASEIYSILTDFWSENKDDMNTENKGWAWKLAFFINKYSSIAHDFYLLCTPHVKKSDIYTLMAKSSGEFAQDLLNELPAEYIQKSNPNKVFAQQTKKWLSIYPDILSAHRNVLTGDSINSTIDFSSEIRDRISTSVNDFINSDGNCEGKYIQDFEHDLELLALCYFATAYTYPEKYKTEIVNLKLIFSIAEEFKLKRIQQIIQIYIARLALENRFMDEADTALEKGYVLRKSNYRNLSGVEHISDKWLNVLKSESLLIKHKNDESIKNKKQTTRQRIVSDAGLELNDNTNLKPDIQLEKINKIEDLFKGYTDPKSKIRLKRGVFLPLEAQTYYLLGRANIEKAKILGKNLPTEKDSKNGRDLLDAFEKARNYLCEAYSILKQMEYSELTLLDEIADDYIEMVRLNYELSGLSEEDILKRLPEREEMDTIVKNFEMQKCTEIVFEAIKTNVVDLKGDYVQQIAGLMETGIKHIIPEVRRFFVVEKKDNEWDLSQFESEDIKDTVQTVLVNSSGKGIDEHDFYYKKYGKIMICINLKSNENRKLIMEIDIQLNEHAYKLLLEIKKLISNLLTHFDLRKELENANESDYKNKRSMVLKSSGKIFENLFAIHNPTLTHSIALAQMLLLSAQEMKKEDPSLEIDFEEVYFAGLLHDIGKLDLDPFLILDKASKLLPYERQKVEQHALCTAKVLRGLLGFKDFKNVIALSVAHHIQYGLEQSYPFNSLGDNNMFILRQLCDYLSCEDNHKEEDQDFLDDEEKQFLLSDKSKLSDTYTKLSRDIVILDQLQAIRAADRNYRDPIPLNQFEGYILSRIGRDFDPERAIRIIELIKSGLFSIFIARQPSDVRVLKNLKSTFIIEWDDIFDFLIQNQTSLENECGIPFDSMVNHFKKSRGKNLKIGYSALRAGFCQIFIDYEKDNGLSEDEAREAGKNKFFAIQDKIFQFINQYFQIAA